VEDFFVDDFRVLFEMTKFPSVGDLSYSLASLQFPLHAVFYILLYYTYVPALFCCSEMYCPEGLVFCARRLTVQTLTTNRVEYTSTELIRFSKIRAVTFGKSSGIFSLQSSGNWRNLTAAVG
jgi:hypothetical protein